METKKRLDLVDREAVKDAIGFMNLHFLGHGETKSVLDSINEVPAVDAVEVKHGRWILAKPRVKGRNATYRCTACGKLRSSYYNDVFQWEYCPCGAKMDGDGNG